MPAVAGIQTSIVKEFKDNPDVEIFTYNQGGRFNETEEWSKTIWQNYYLASPLIYDALGGISTTYFNQADTDLPFERSFIIDADGRCVSPYFGYQPQKVIEQIYTLLAARKTREITIPHLTGGAETWKDILNIDNLSGIAHQYSLTLQDVNGDLLYQGTHSIAPYACLSLDLKEFTAEAVGGTIECKTKALTFRISYQYQSSGESAEFQLLNNNASALVFNFYSTLSEPLSWKGIAVVNTGTEAAALILEAYSEGKLQATTSVTVAAGNRLAGQHSDWFPEIPVNELERIVVHGNQPSLQGIALSGNAEISRLVFVPALSKLDLTP